MQKKLENVLFFLFHVEKIHEIPEMQKIKTNTDFLFYLIVYNFKFDEIVN